MLNAPNPEDEAYLPLSYGTIRTYNPKEGKGLGLIECDDGSEPLSFREEHFLQPAAYAQSDDGDETTLRARPVVEIGMRVEFLIEMDTCGRRVAKSVTLPRRKLVNSTITPVGPAEDHQNHSHGHHTHRKWTKNYNHVQDHTGPAGSSSNGGSNGKDAPNGMANNHINGGSKMQMMHEYGGVDGGHSYYHGRGGGHGRRGRGAYWKGGRGRGVFREVTDRGREALKQ
ncbi:unnamed protein product [Vitrella brassicaformis CCMP3155]|uniref:Uncharacterized protein n=1 Tax=Vitrella brassicaformis (strain CCMP3155) TaxID=1169540 RepID=A0A0G4EXL8_VITBC|nr:unnamed protein product [Vitrella brassicaformis CCMP3155]|eukprot:CEM03568.1 unnamed protein product [Vitrella brassicaformis CCMP3155]